MRAQPPMRVPTTRRRLTQLTRRGSISLGTSTPAAAAPCSRNAVRVAFLPRRDLEATGSRAARWRKGRAPTRAVGRHRAGCRGHRPLGSGHRRPRRPAPPRCRGRVARRWPPSKPTGSRGTRRAPVVVDHDGPGGQRPVGDSGLPQHHQLGEDSSRARRRSRPAVGQRPVAGSRTGAAAVPRAAGPRPLGRARSVAVGVVVRLRREGRSRREGGEPAAGRWPGDQQRVVGRTGRPGSQHRRHPGPGPGGHQAEVRLVLDLLAAGQGQCRSGIAVEEETGRLGQQLGIGRVTAVDRHIDLAAVDRPGEPADTPLLVGHRAPPPRR